MRDDLPFARLSLQKGENVVIEGTVFYRIGVFRPLEIGPPTVRCLRASRDERPIPGDVEIVDRENDRLLQVSLDRNPKRIKYVLPLRRAFFRRVNALRICRTDQGN